ncbi:MAG: hypothetical protein R3B13_04105 [Polyangiaceae bacterium]
MSDAAFWVGIMLLILIGSKRAAQARTESPVGAGADLVLVGVAIAPSMLGLVERRLLTAAAPFAEAASAWIGLLLGLRAACEPRIGGFRRSFAALLLVLGSSSLAGLTFWLAAPQLLALSPHDRLGAACGVAAITMEWVQSFRQSAAPETPNASDSLYAGLVQHGSICAVLALVVASAIGASPLHQALGPSLTVAAQGVLGATIGLLAAALLRIEPRPTQAFGILLGITLLSVGVANRYELAAIGLCMVCGWTAAALSKRGAEIRAWVGTSEHALMVPLLIYSGAATNPSTMPWIVRGIALAVACRLLLRAVVGLSWQAVAGRRKDPWLGVVSTVATGRMSLVAALAFALIRPGPGGSIVLGAAVLSALSGDLLQAIPRRVASAAQVSGAPS